jgi:predicted phosphoribosyltransferase/dienelactone hydrolase
MPPSIHDDRAAPGERAVHIGPLKLEGTCTLPADALGIVLFAHGSGSSRFSPRNRQVAEALANAAFATLLFDLLTESEARDRANVFDIPLLSQRLEQAVDWVRNDPETRALPIGLFGASTGAAATLMVAARRPDDVKAVVSRGGRPDLAGGALSAVSVPTLLIVGGDDTQVLALNRQALAALPGEKTLAVVPAATHLFEEPGALESVCDAAARWFTRWLPRARSFEREVRVFSDRREAGRLLAARLMDLEYQSPVILALPRGGVPVAAEIARALKAPLDLVLVRKIGAPMQAELAVGAVVDGAEHELVINEDIVRLLDVPRSYIDAVCKTEIAEIERRRTRYFGGRRRADVAGRVAVIVDDGVATGSTMRAAIRATRRRKPTKLIVAVPVGAPETILELKPEADEVRCLLEPEGLGAIGLFYRDFSQVSDDEVKSLLDENARQMAAS